MTVWTIGHSSRSFDELIALLAQYDVQAIADVRRHPGSRRQPWFARDALANALPVHGLVYQWLPALGGRRRPAPDSPNDAWRNESFRGYADHLQTEEFAGGLAELLALAERHPTALMCAEVLWWRCHRALISDVLKVRGIEVVHILGERKTTVHPYTSAATVSEGQLSYSSAP